VVRTFNLATKQFAGSKTR